VNDMKTILALMIFGSIATFVASALDSRSKKKSMDERVKALDTTQDGISLEEIEMSKSFSERVLVPVFTKIGGALGNYTPSGFLERIEKKLLSAGMKKTDPLAFLGLKGIISVCVLIAALIVGSIMNIEPGAFAMNLLALPAISFVLPDIWLSSVDRARKTEINDSLPDLLDLLTVSVEAGLGFEQALKHSSEKMKGKISDEVKRMLQEMRVGKKRSEALRDMSDRVEIPDLTSFAAAMIQADQLGVSVADVLRVQSDAMRQKRRQRAEEAAMKAPLKLLFPLVFFIFPTLFIILLGPAFISIMENFQSG